MDEDKRFGGRNRALTVAVVGLVVASLAVAGVAVNGQFVGSSTAQTQESATITAGSANTSPNGTTSVGLTLSTAPEGVSGYDLVVRLSDPSVGTITNASVADAFGLDRVSVSDNGTMVTLSGVDVDENVQPGATGISLGTVEITGESTGASDIVVEQVNLDDDNGTAVEPSTTPGTLTVAGAGTGTPTSTEQPTETGTATETDTATATETSAPEPTATTGTDTPTATATAAPTDTEAGTTTATDGTTGPTVTDTETSAPTETGTTAAPTETTDDSARTETGTDSASTETETSGVGTGSDGNGAQTGGDADGGADSGNEADGNADAGTIDASLADSGLSDEQVSGVSSALAASGLTDAETSTITDALASDGLSDEQRTAIADAIAGGDLSDDQLVALSEALDDGSLTNAERDALGFLGSDETTYYQVDLVRGEPIEQLQGPNGTYTNEELLRFAHGSSEEPITRRSDGEFTTDAALADRIESRNVTVENGTATTTFTVADGESVTLSLVSYTKPGPVWSPATEQLQNYVDSDSRTFESGTHTLRVDLPTNTTGE
ncbi:hypothetical protein [Halococcus thailandensis]|uniref:Uncharacterized protein n=1 Tax=Halococcus thailandensis JCM 13552 TaxID=1227457 RepID=M0N751_9EURY|nr:hypothetical protein [Halococcus thailandensis]EMA52949.1 hypothetical protein C451_11030 [Halococcus thailandensis JCM 13552]